MARADVEFVREGYEAIARGDLDTFTELAREHLDPDFEFHHVWDGTVFRGFEGTMEWLSDTRETWHDYSQEIVELVERDDLVVVVLSISGRGGGSGVPVAQELAVVWRFAGGRAVEARSYTTREEALTAAGIARDQGGRSAYIASTLRRALEDERRWEQIASAAGTLEAGGHDWDDDPARLGRLPAAGCTGNPKHFPMEELQVEHWPAGM